MGHVGHVILVSQFGVSFSLWVICDDPQETRMGIGFALFVGHFLRKRKSLAPSVELQHTVVYIQHNFHILD